MSMDQRIRKPLKAAPAPVSSAMVVANSLARRSTMSAALRNSVWRWRGVASAHAGKAAAAASTAACASARPPAAISA